MSNPSPKLDYAVVECRASIARSAQSTWQVIGDYAAMGSFLNIASEQLSGTGGPGSVRRVGDAVIEVMVGASLHSYTYAQVEGPMARFNYHGCVRLETIDSAHCELVYTLVYEQGTMEPSVRDSEHERLKTRFDGAVVAMSKAAQA